MKITFERLEKALAEWKAKPKSGSKATMTMDCSWANVIIQAHEEIPALLAERQALRTALQNLIAIVECDDENTPGGDLYTEIITANMILSGETIGDYPVECEPAVAS